MFHAPDHNFFSDVIPDTPKIVFLTEDIIVCYLMDFFIYSTVYYGLIFYLWWIKFHYKFIEWDDEFCQFQMLYFKTQYLNIMFKFTYLDLRMTIPIKFLNTV